jgi:hypothetical protein
MLEKEPKPTPELSESKVGQLWEGLGTLDWDGYEEFEFDGVSYLILDFPPDHLDEEGEGWFRPSTHIDGIDVYALETLPPEEKKKRVFHEILEAWAQRFSLDQPHDFAIDRERKFWESKK